MDLFRGEMDGVQYHSESRARRSTNRYRLNDTLKGFCICDTKTHTNSSLQSCGGRSTLYTALNMVEPATHIRIGVPIIIEGRGRHKRHIEEVLHTSDGRFYPTSYR